MAESGMVKIRNSVESSRFFGLWRAESEAGFAAKFSKIGKIPGACILRGYTLGNPTWGNTRYFADFSDFCQILPQKSW